MLAAGAHAIVTPQAPSEPMAKAKQKQKGGGKRGKRGKSGSRQSGERSSGKSGSRPPSSRRRDDDLERGVSVPVKDSRRRDDRGYDRLDRGDPGSGRRSSASGRRNRQKLRSGEGQSCFRSWLSSNKCALTHRSSVHTTPVNMPWTIPRSPGPRSNGRRVWRPSRRVCVGVTLGLVALLLVVLLATGALTGGGGGAADVQLDQQPPPAGGAPHWVVVHAMC